MKRYLVTGGAGFIGSHVVEVLLAQGHSVTVIDNFDPFYSRELKCDNLRIAQESTRFRLFEIDICDRTALTEAADSYDAIIHLAGKAGVRPSLVDPLAYQRVNVGGTQNLLEMAKEWSVKQLVFASSSSVYGINPRTPWREDDPVLLPISPYASTKISGELLGHVYSHLYGIRFIALRFFTVYGPRQRPDLAIHKFARLMLEHRPIPLYGDGSARRDYTFITDIVAAVRRAVDYDGSMYEVLNIGNDRTISLAEMVHSLEEVLSIEAVVQRHPQQPGDVPQTWADLKKARLLLGYEPQTCFADGLHQFASWLRPAVCGAETPANVTS